MGVVVTGAAHEGDAGDDRPVAVATDDPLRTEPVLNRDDRRVREASLECRCRRVERGSLRRDDRDVEFGDLVRIVRCANRAAELGAPGHPQPLRLKGAGVLAPAREHPDVRDPAEMRGVEAADHTGPDDADSLDHPAVAIPSPKRPILW